jgi:hypothetical protein
LNRHDVFGMPDDECFICPGTGGLLAAQAMESRMMPRRIRYVLAGCVCAGLFALVGVCGAADMGGTVKQVCSRCHSTKRICLNLGVKSENAWKSTVAKMVEKGAQLPAGQVDATASYLSQQPPDSGAFCD